MNVLVVGAGVMGRWLGRALDSDADEDVSLTFADADTNSARAAADAVSGSVVATPDDSRFDVVAIAVPIPAAVAAIETWAPAAEGAVVDVTGTMAEPVEAMQTHAPDCAHVSLHPLFAPPNEPGTVAVVANGDSHYARSIGDVLRRRGNDLYETTPAEHDDAMRTVQTRTHAAVLAYALAADDVPEDLHTPVSAALEDVVDQVTGGEPRVYADIQATFDGAGDVAEAARKIAQADTTTFEELYERAGE